MYNGRWQHLYNFGLAGLFTEGAYFCTAQPKCQYGCTRRTWNVRCIFLFSVYLVLQAGEFHSGPGLYFETSAVLITLNSFSEKYLKQAQKVDSSDAIKKLMGLQPKMAIVERDGVTE